MDNKYTYLLKGKCLTFYYLKAKKSKKIITVNTNKLLEQLPNLTTMIMVY